MEVNLTNKKIHRQEEKKELEVIAENPEDTGKASCPVPG